MAAQHIISVSGGKDSTATLILAVQRGMPFQAVFADTGHENPVTLDYVKYLSDRFNIDIQHVRACFRDRIVKKRKYVKENWASKGVSDEIIEAVLKATHATGNPFLDLVIWKGRFPSTKAQFCTQHLKSDPIFEQAMRPRLELGHVVSWTGERREESKRRKNLPKIQVTPFKEFGHSVIRVRPLVEKTAEWVFALHEKYQVKVNPLYMQGFSRVGCFPCIHARKSELRQIIKRYPDEVARLREWEKIAGRASKRQQSTFFGAGTTPRSRAHRKEEWRKEYARMDTLGLFDGLEDGDPRPEVKASALPETIDEVFDWSLTSRGGVQKDAFLLDGPQCQSEYGLCD